MLKEYPLWTFLPNPSNPSRPRKTARKDCMLGIFLSAKNTGKTTWPLVRRIIHLQTLQNFQRSNMVSHEFPLKRLLALRHLIKQVSYGFHWFPMVSLWFLYGFLWFLFSSLRQEIKPSSSWLVAPWSNARKDSSSQHNSWTLSKSLMAWKMILGGSSQADVSS